MFDEDTLSKLKEDIFEIGKRPPVRLPPTFTINQ
jgi:hypothetical protein